MGVGDCTIRWRVSDLIAPVLPCLQDVLTELEAMPSLMQAPTLLLVQRPAVSIADVTSYKHPIPVEQERIDIGQVRCGAPAKLS